MVHSLRQRLITASGTFSVLVIIIPLENDKRSINEICHCCGFWRLRSRQQHQAEKSLNGVYSETSSGSHTELAQAEWNTSVLKSKLRYESCEKKQCAGNQTSGLADASQPNSLLSASHHLDSSLLREILFRKDYLVFQRLHYLWKTLCTPFRPLFTLHPEDSPFLADVRFYHLGLMRAHVITTIAQGTKTSGPLGPRFFFPSYLLPSISTFSPAGLFYFICLTPLVTKEKKSSCRHQTDSSCLLIKHSPQKDCLAQDTGGKALAETKISKQTTLSQLKE